MLKELRQARYGYLLGLHILLLCAKGRTPSEIADSLFCSRSSVYRAVAAYQHGQSKRGWDAAADAEAPPKLLGWHRSLLSVLKRTPHAYGWCRTRWSCATLSLQLAAQTPLHGLARDHPARPPPAGLCVEASAPRGA
jgi:hypothetical protein